MPLCSSPSAACSGEVAQVGDHVVAGAPLELRHPPEVEPRRRLPERRHLRLGDRQPELALALGEGDPELAPQPGAMAGGEDSAPHRGGIALVERVLRVSLGLPAAADRSRRKNVASGGVRGAALPGGKTKRQREGSIFPAALPKETER